MIALYSGVISSYLTQEDCTKIEIFDSIKQSSLLRHSITQAKIARKALIDDCLMG